MSSWIELSILAGLIIAAASATVMWLRADERAEPKPGEDDGFWAGGDPSTCGGCGGCSGCGGCGS